MAYSLELRLNIMDQKLSQVPKDAVARYRLALHYILEDTSIVLTNPFPLYYPGMPAYDKARKD